MSTWYPKNTPNGWYPKINLTGTHVLYGFWECHLVDLATEQEYEIKAPTGERLDPLSWLDARTFIAATEAGPAAVYSISLDTLEPVLIPNAAPFGGSHSWGGAGSGHWGLYLQAAGNAQPYCIKDGIPFHPEIDQYKIAINGDHLVTADKSRDYELQHFVGNDLVRRLPTDAEWRVSVEGDIVTGYYGVVDCYPFGQGLVDATVTPWRKEEPGCPVRVNNELWLWNGADEAENGLIFGRRVGEKNPIVLRGFPSVFTSAVWTGTVWIVAGNDDKGRLQVRRVPMDSERETLTPIVPVEPIIALNRPHWLGFFTGKPGVLGGWDTNDDPPEFQDAHALPGNGYFDVPSSTFYNDRDEPIGTFIHQQPGWTVETIEEAAKNTPYTPIAYWDSRNWPRWPNLPANSWLCLQAYCKRDEPFSVFEADIRAKLLDLQQNKPQQKIAIVAQSYWQTPVNTNTDNLSGLVPIFSRLAAEFPNVIATIPFNGNGRFSGMQNHPEIRPLWEQFAAGITGEPQMSKPQLPPEICEAVIKERNKYGTPPTSAELAQILNDTAWQFRPDWGVSRKDSGNRVNSPDRPGLGNIASDILHRKSDNLMWDVLHAAGEASTPNCGESIGEMTDPNRPWVAPVQPPDVPEPIPGVVSVVIQYHDAIVRRSDPNGMLIRFDCSSPNRIIEIECALEDDEEPSIIIKFLDEERRDGRYCRALAIKPVRNGIWTLRVKAKDNTGNVGQSDGTHKVEVTL